MKKKITEVQKIFAGLDKDIGGFQKKTGISCVQNCFHCCLKKDIHATVLEFLPLANFLYQENRIENILAKLESTPDNKICALFSTITYGDRTLGCSEYAYRGLICRLFGLSANMDKHGQPAWITCQPLKLKYPDKLKDQKVNTQAPLMSKYYSRLYAIDFKLAVTYYPINEAIKKAIELVLFYYSYRGKKVS
ncbi:MAG: hypothetical protein JXJ22_06195 [Bacteroidales bacterium]|nr:hypothetical protein [Bacteroidales bacterium]